MVNYWLRDVCGFPPFPPFPPWPCRPFPCRGIRPALTPVSAGKIMKVEIAAENFMMGIGTSWLHRSQRNVKGWAKEETELLKTWNEVKLQRLTKLTERNYSTAAKIKEGVRKQLKALHFQSFCLLILRSHGNQKKCPVAIGRTWSICSQWDYEPLHNIAWKYTFNLSWVLRGQFCWKCRFGSHQRKSVWLSIVVTIDRWPMNGFKRWFQ